jgi:ubiquinone biosynthesis protein
MPAVSRWRFVRAYSTTFLVIASYVRLSFASRFFGRGYRERHIRKVHQRNARRVYRTILALQGLFIKVGQLLSILANFLPEEFRAELEGLQDQVPPRPYAQIAQRIEEDLGGPITDHFEFVREEPVASASLGQVHEARLKDGTRVVVKVQHRDVDEIVRLDTRTIRRILRIVQMFVPVQGLDGYYVQIRSLLEQELDFVREAESIETIAKNFANDPKVIMPVPIRRLSTRKVLTTTFVEGHKISDAAAIDALGIDKKDVARRLVRVYCQMIFVDGHYHADPHPGNILVRKDGALILLDFGAVAFLSPNMKEGISAFLESVLRRDTAGLVKAMRTMGFLARTADEEVSEKVIEYFHRRFQEEIRIESFNLKDIQVDPQRGLENVLDLRRMNIGLKEISSAFVIPKDWVLLERTMLLLYGSCSLLDPELAPMTVIQPYLREFVLGNRDWSEIVTSTIRDLALNAVTLPDDAKKYLRKATRGELEVRVRGLEEGARVVYAAGRQLIYTSLAIASGFAALTLHDRGEDVPAKSMLGVSGFCMMLLVLSSFLARPPAGRWR